MRLKSPRHAPLPQASGREPVRNRDPRISRGDRNGDRLTAIEAMKMETSIFAPRDGLISDLPIKVGDMVDARELLCVIDG